MATLRMAVAVWLVLMAGCAKPPTDTWPSRVSTAFAGRAASVPDHERPDYESGFADGATMVQQALKTGERPFRPVVNLPAPPPRMRGTAPEGGQTGAFAFSRDDATIETTLPIREVDADTGLLLFPATAVRSPAFARGQVEGFTWALSAIGQNLVHPVPVLVFPTTWFPFTRPKDGQDLDAGGKIVRLLWAPGHLAWSWKARGFPGHRMWRTWQEAEAPGWIGLTDQAIWVETWSGHAVALDLESGGILQVLPSIPHTPRPPERTWENHQEEVRREFNAPAFQDALVGLRKAAESGEIRDLLAVAKRLSGMGEQADREAYTWYLKAAEKGNPEAMLRVGVLLFHGQSATGDKAAARHWLERAAQAGQSDAQDVLKMLFQASE